MNRLGVWCGLLVLVTIASGEVGTSSSAGCMTTPSRPDRYGDPSKGNAPCILPFRTKRRTYYNCASGNAASNVEDNASWCSTKVDSNGRHVNGQGEWGYCSQSCEVNCTSSEFTCALRNQCIKAEYKCNGRPNCEDGSDEGPATCGCFGGISCCSQGFTPGANNGDDGENFIQASEYLTNCEVSCKTKYPIEATGVTESLLETYSSGDGKNKNKCWCEFGTPKLDSSNANYQTCVFPKVEGSLGNRWKFNGGTGWLGVSRPSSVNGTECCDLCRKEYPTTEFFQFDLEPQYSMVRRGSTRIKGQKYYLCSCLEPVPDEAATTWYQDYFTQYCGTDSSFEAGVEGGLGDGRKFTKGTGQFSVAGDDVQDRSQCCDRCSWKDECDLILYKKTPDWECCWYYRAIPGRKVQTSVPLDEFRLTGSCGATSG